MSTSTIKSATEKINLAERSNAFHAKVAAEREQKAVDFVESTAIPFLVDCAEKGERMAVFSYPSGLMFDDVRKALGERVACQTHKVGYDEKVKVTW